ncbi:hypothetical protein I79_011945 [Cricetulus griseus]|uniref:Uncharacterized protein n=1 Tax=Cricetulus griseus TaxID=10029 RepID=G3HMI2_CRIGR|nr:hypothetical protein I79_011945 [Cricetulus griseus]
MIMLRGNQQGRTTEPVLLVLRNLKKWQLSLMASVCNSSTWETEEDRSQAGGQTRVTDSV